MWTKYFNYVLYGIAVTFFINYVKVSYLISFYYDVLFCDYENMSRFDYIIVGAGSAGSVLAAKLSSAGEKTLLVEAGGAPAFFFNIPIIAPILLNSPYDWRYLTVPQKNACKGLDNNQSVWSSGKILGGSSRLNYMIYSTGHPNDYDSWMDNLQEPVVENGGSLCINYDNWSSRISDAILNGIVELSYSLKNPNDSSSTGFMKAPLTTKNGERWSTDRILYQNSSKRLKILTNSFVKKIIFKSNKAIGIEFLKGYNTYKAFAKKGVVLSAGAIGTPKLLMLSGVGPKEHLKEHNIKTIADLPVGQHLMDHIITGLDLVIVNTTAMGVADILNPLSFLDYYLYGKGPWTTSGVGVIGTFHSKLMKNKQSIPDLQIIALSVGISQDNGILLGKNLGVSDKVLKEYFIPLAYSTAITIAPVLLHPKSTGEIKLTSSNPFDPPMIDPKYLSHEKDILTLVEGIQFVKTLVETKVMKKYNAQLYRKPLPGCEHINFDSLEYWKCYVQHMTLSTYHPAGTCKIGDVVDSRFRVYKTKNLFVVDASVFPRLPSGNIHGPTVMLAEKASRLLTESLKNCNSKVQQCYRNDVFLLSNTCY
ncbi:glucose dehydrogenase [FAD, quinone]-like [Copidosoma floridanum]|uniref:glucose dehydrogenase [FAD, quinone]-like n=1 Tax=Copidosoma floridanum TaxID=29053 RepID=UPI0006C96450|nr:glucose dehydrogenase [FAD, quinone]-like [Copidosoma floridanum]